MMQVIVAVIDFGIYYLSKVLGVKNECKWGVFVYKGLCGFGVY